mgnify:FL=1
MTPQQCVTIEIPSSFDQGLSVSSYYPTYLQCYNEFEYLAIYNECMRFKTIK